MENCSQVNPDEINLKVGEAEVVGDNTVTRLENGSLEVRAPSGWDGNETATTIVKPVKKGSKVFTIGRSIKGADGEIKKVKTVFRV